MRRPVKPLAPNMSIFMVDMLYGYSMRKDNAFMGNWSGFSKEFAEVAFTRVIGG
jgi:hypothetical protein